MMDTAALSRGRALLTRVLLGGRSTSLRRNLRGRWRRHRRIGRRGRLLGTFALQNLGSKVRYVPRHARVVGIQRHTAGDAVDLQCGPPRFGVPNPHHQREASSDAQKLIDDGLKRPRELKRVARMIDIHLLDTAQLRTALHCRHRHCDEVARDHPPRNPGCIRQVVGIARNLRDRLVDGRAEADCKPLVRRERRRRPRLRPVDDVFGLPVLLLSAMCFLLTLLVEQTARATRADGLRGYLHKSSGDPEGVQQCAGIAMKRTGTVMKLRF